MREKKREREREREREKEKKREREQIQMTGFNNHYCPCANIEPETPATTESLNIEKLFAHLFFTGERRKNYE